MRSRIGRRDCDMLWEFSSGFQSCGTFLLTRDSNWTFLDRVLLQDTVFSVPRTSHHAVGEEEARLSLVTADAVLHARS